MAVCLTWKIKQSCCEQEQGTEDEESYEADFLDISFGDDEEDDTAVASKVRVAHYVETRVLISTVKKLT